jgi:hypothetical protein
MDVNKTVGVMISVQPQSPPPPPSARIFRDREPVGTKKLLVVAALPLSMQF